jgi:hypothetical protein
VPVFDEKEAHRVRGADCSHRAHCDIAPAAFELSVSRAGLERRGFSGKVPSTLTLAAEPEGRRRSTAISRCCGRRGTAWPRGPSGRTQVDPPRPTKGDTVIVVGLVLLLLGFLLKIAILWTLGIIVLVVGLILMLLGGMGRAVGGRRHYY